MKKQRQYFRYSVDTRPGPNNTLFVDYTITAPKSGKHIESASNAMTVHDPYTEPIVVIHNLTMALRDINAVIALLLKQLRTERITIYDKETTP